MAEVKKEISGFFLSAEKFAAHVEALASPACLTSHLRLFHNEPHHTAAVVQALSQNASVTNFDIFELDAASAAALAAVLSSTPRLTSLAVHHLHDAAAVTHLASGLASNTTLTHLTFSQLDPNGLAAIANAIVAWADGSPISPSSSTAAAMAAADPLVPRPARLQHLHLDKCRFSPEAARALADALGGQAGSLVRLEVVESEVGDTAAAALLGAPGWAALRRAPALVALDLSSCNIGPKGAALLGDFLSTSSSLQSLCLANNKALGCAGAAALQPGLAANRSLRRLDLTACGLGPSGAQALAAALSPASVSAGPTPADSDAAAAGSGDGGAAGAQRPSSQPAEALPANGQGGCQLQHLVLGDNATGAAGLLALLRTLSGPSPCGLRSLVLDRNHIRGAELAEALEGLPAQAAPSAAAPAAAAAAPKPPPLLVTAPLEQLSLAGNSLYDVGVAALAACLAEAPALEQLDLRENGIADGGVAALLPLVARGGGGGTCAGAGAGCFPALQGLLLDGNRLHNSGGQALLEAVTAAPWLWRFSAEANKLTDPALRLSLTQLSQLRAARHSQLVVLGRQYSSSSSSSSGDDARRASGGGASGGGASGARSRGGSEGGRGGGTTPMDLDGSGPQRQQNPQQQAPGGSGNGGGGGGGAMDIVQHHQQLQQHLKHRREDRSEGGASSCGGDEEQQPLRNVAARNGIHLPGSGAHIVVAGVARGGGVDGSSHAGFVSGGSGGGVPGAMGHIGGLSEALSCMPSGRADRAEGDRANWHVARSSAGGCSHDSSCSLGSSSLGGGHHLNGTSAADGARGCGGAVSSAGGMLGTSPPPAVCFITAVTGVGGSASVPVSKRVHAAGEAQLGSQHHQQPPQQQRLDAAAASKLPQQILPACRRPRYKPLTAEQQRLFEDF